MYSSKNPYGNKTENNELYELQKEQRYNERMIRGWERRKKATESAGLDSKKETLKVKEWRDINKNLIDSDDRLKHNYGREKMYLPKKNGIIGISSINIPGALDPNSKNANQHAEIYYDSVRKMKPDYKKTLLILVTQKNLLKK